MTTHPSAHIAPEIANALRTLAAEAEQLQQLHPAQLAIIFENNWFNVFVPKTHNGLQLSLPEVLQLEEALAWADGSVGWTITLCAGAGWFVGFLNAELGTTIFEHSKVCLAGSGKASGKATITTDGYEISGLWDYATGANAATAFTANCVIEQNGVPLKNGDGSLLIRAFLFLKEEVTIHENWKRMGMTATGSHSFGVQKITVNKNRAFIIDPQHAVLKDPVYQYPFLQLAETTLAVNSSGMAMRFLELCVPIAEKRSTTAMLLILKNAVQQMETARQLFYATVITSWQECCNNLSISSTVLQNVSSASKALAITSRKMVEELYPYCGMQAANPETELNRVWRNLHTASQHSIFND
ncbi:acyl-CoA dehydrogenase [Ferruginibacter sp. SUN106]|uniref:acyl-CoA dehydrogenase n=1 Tax=Ferruginibacter sp. SUN106 TaxID=2978348 RepID=UPI003D36CBA9